MKKQQNIISLNYFLQAYYVYRDFKVPSMNDFIKTLKYKNISLPTKKNNCSFHTNGIEEFSSIYFLNITV